jgi:hypothetical protein
MEICLVMVNRLVSRDSRLRRADRVMPKMRDALSPNAREVAMREITPRERAEFPRRLDSFPPMMATPSSYRVGASKLGDAGRLR